MMLKKKSLSELDITLFSTILWKFLAGVLQKFVQLLKSSKKLDFYQQRNTSYIIVLEELELVTKNGVMHCQPNGKWLSLADFASVLGKNDGHTDDNLSTQKSSEAVKDIEKHHEMLLKKISYGMNSNISYVSTESKVNQALAPHISKPPDSKLTANQCA